MKNNMLNLKIKTLSRTKCNITLFGEGCQTIVLSFKNIVCYMLVEVAYWLFIQEVMVQLCSVLFPFLQPKCCTVLCVALVRPA